MPVPSGTSCLNGALVLPSDPRCAPCQQGPLLAGAGSASTAETGANFAAAPAADSSAPPVGNIVVASAVGGAIGIALIAAAVAVIARRRSRTTSARRSARPFAAGVSTLDDPDMSPHAPTPCHDAIDVTDKSWAQVRQGNHVKVG